MNVLSIPPDADGVLLAVLLVLVAIGTWIERKPGIGQFGVLFILLAGAALGAVGILPRHAPLYGLVWTFFVPLSIPLLLFRADLARIWRESGRMLLAFGVAVVGVLCGAVAGMFAADLGADEPLWAAIMSAGFIGGSANTAAVADALGRAEAPYFSVVVASVFFVAVPFFGLLLALPGIPWLWRLWSPRTEANPVQLGDPNPQASASREISAASLVAALALSAAIVAVSDWIASLVHFGEAKYLAITALSISIAMLFPRQAQRINGHYEIGQILIYVFFAIIGAQIDFGLALQSGQQIILFTVVLLGVHVVVLSILGRLLGISGPELAIASQASIGGPATAAAMAVAKDWRALVTPGLMCGILGYAVANFIAIIFARMF